MSQHEDPQPPSTSGAKRTCGVMPYHYTIANAVPGYASARRMTEMSQLAGRVELLAGFVLIPTVIHIVHQNPNIVTDAEIDDQIRVLNDDFRRRNRDFNRTPAPFQHLIADSQIEFRLARRDPFGRPTTGITRTRTSIGQFPKGPVPDPYDDNVAIVIDGELKAAPTGKAAWPSRDYLNIWVCDMASLMGYASLPNFPEGIDGVVINRPWFGTRTSLNGPTNRGRTLTHEVGHWLNLLHLWGDTENECNEDDNVADTPLQKGRNVGTPTFPRHSCNPNGNGDLFCNYMDYVDDEAMVMFTHGQVARMRAALAGPRRSILSSPGLTPPSPLPEMEVAAAAAHDIQGGSPNQLIFDGVGWVEGLELPPRQ